jgi:polyferredoxin
MPPSPWVKRVLRHAAYPAFFQWMSLVVFAFIVFELLTGPANAKDNLGSVLVWVLWWPMLTVLFFFGRIWCAVCPFSLLSDLLRHVAGNSFKAPPFLKQNGFSMMVGFLLILTLAQEVLHIAESTTITAVMLLVIVTGVSTAGVFFERRSWCRYLCPLGGMAVTYSRTGCVALKGNPTLCHSCHTVNCYKGSQNSSGCPMFEFPRVMDTAAYCSLCGQCLRDCPHDAVDIQLRLPTSELWFIRKPRLQEALLAVLLMGIVLARNVAEFAREGIAVIVGNLPPQAQSIIAYTLCLAIALLLWMIAALAAARPNGERPKVLFARFGYSAIPVVLLSHLGHLAGEFLENGHRVVGNAKAWWHGGHMPGAATAWADDEWVLAVQIGFLLIGFSLSILAASKIAQAHYPAGKRLRQFLPFVAVMLLYTVFTALLISFGEEK